jgi:ParB family transcriptional regulator, chromosome partitioning protein
MESHDSLVLKEITHLPLAQLKEAPWNPNRMDPSLLEKLKNSLQRFGLAGVLVVRLLQRGSGQAAGDDCHEVLSGNQRLQVLRELGLEIVHCAVVHLRDAKAKLLAQTLNSLHGSDDLGLRAQLVEEILRSIPRAEVRSLLPKTAQRLQALSNLNQETIAQSLLNWQQAQQARLEHFTCQLTQEQLKTVEQALHRLRPEAKAQPGDNPNLKGHTLYLLALRFLSSEMN